ncbi:HEAT repeat domain-containing protein [Sphingobacterium sp. InxBP1]|uniref:HEAT repeat domain-containing protein n=1 Tax=Sphingobacterium sp. InxBP1 TaxID=2870328 RepID=UPI002242EEA9|nr:HEAT repeat domain-containing protein [Sphingobacterium sp. InxBP1]MCW8313292.1 HEAT repeat domain-containing protein [Sphingobacterium sp. InxBP1]
MNTIRTFFEGEGWSVFVLIALILSVLFWIGCIIGIAIFYHRDYRYRNCYSITYPILRDFIYEHVLMGDQINHFPVDKLRLHLNNKLVGKVVRDIFHEFIRSIGGEKGRSMRNLFGELGFDREAQYEIRHSAKHMVTMVRSLADLALMQIKVEDKVLRRLLSSPKVEIRVAACKYLIQLEGEQAFDHIFSELEEINELHALDIYQTIVISEYFGTYAFSQWLGVSKSFAFNKLMMDLMVHFHQNDAAQLWELIRHSQDLRTLSKAINSLGKLMSGESEERLIALYDQHDLPSVRMEILKAIGRLGTEQSVVFLVQVFGDRNLPMKLRKHAYRSLIALKPYSAAYVNKISITANAEDEKLIRHIMHPMIHYI